MANQILGSAVDADNLIYPFVTLPADANKLFSVSLTTSPTPAGLTFGMDGTFTWSGLPVGTHRFGFRTYCDAMAYGGTRINEVIVVDCAATLSWMAPTTGELVTGGLLYAGEELIGSGVDPYPNSWMAPTTGELVTGGTLYAGEELIG